MNENMLYAIDWTAIGIVSVVIFMPILLVFLYLGYRHYLTHQKRIMNDELILKLAREGQTLTPEIIESIRHDEEKKQDDSMSSTLSEAYQKLCTGGALILGGLIVLIRNRVVALVMITLGLFIAAQGLALYLSNKPNTSHDDTPSA